MSQDKNNGHNLELDKKRPIFQGTGKRAEMMKYIIQIARENLPISQREFIDIVAFNTSMNPRTVQEGYINLLVSVHILQMNKNMYELGEKEKGLC